MTVKEAIDRLKYDREMCYFDPSTGETGQPYSEDCKEMAEALDIAIEALKNESGEQSEQKTGQWIYMKDCEDCWLCSNCKDIFILLEGTPKDNNYNYCPNCGAKMEREGE